MEPAERKVRKVKEKKEGFNPGSINSAEAADRKFTPACAPFDYTIVSLFTSFR